ncbi:ABC transporter substrate-binding protein [soil metagenome]
MKILPTLFVVTLLLLTGCGEAKPGAGERRPAELVGGAGADVSPSGAFHARLGVYPLNVNVAETLTRLTADYRVEPLLATRWEYQGDNTWRFFLRRGVFFHDGQPLDARAVEASITQAVQGGFGYGTLDEKSVKIVGDHTVDITTTRPNLRLPEQLVHPNNSIFAPQTTPGVRPVGTGPFRWVEYLPNQRIVVERNDAYWGEKARMPRITFRFFPDATTRVFALLAGEVDLVMDLPREQVPSFTARPELTVARARVGQMLNLLPNAHGQGQYDLLTDPALRRAISFSIDRGRLVNQVWNGEGKAVQNMTVPAILDPFAAQVHGFPYDPLRAERLLDSAGWHPGPNGVRQNGGRLLRLVMLASPSLESGIAEFVQAQLRRVGVEVQWVRLPDAGSYAARLGAGEFDLDLATPNQNDGNPLFLPALIFHSQSDNPFARWHYVGEQFDRLVEAGMRAPDPTEARRLAAEAIKLAVDDETIVISLAGRFRLYALKKRVDGFVPHPSQTNKSWTRVHFRSK